MPDPVLVRVAGVPAWLLLWLFALAAFFLFGRRVVEYIQVLRKARPEPRWDRIPERLRLVAANVLGQRRMLDEPVIGAAHLIIFWSFVVFAGTFFWNLLRGLAPLPRFPYADEVVPVALALEFAGVFGLIALGVAAVRRYAFTPPRLERSRDATIILLLIAIVLLTSLAGSGFSALREPDWRPAGRVIAGWFAAAGVTPAGAGTFYVAAWWVHMMTVLGFLAYLPYSKHLHLLASPFGVFFADLQPGRAPAPSEGAAKLEEFTWRQLFNGLACAECGRCDRACPSVASGYALSPKQLMHEMKMLVRSGGRAELKVKPEEVWACATCAACMSRCPVFNEHIPVVTEIRRKLVAEGAIDARLQTALMNLTRYGNSFGQSPRNRTKWVQSLGFKPKDARKEAVEYLVWVGDYASYDPRAQAGTLAAMRVLQRAGVDFGILYEGEQNAGNDLRRAGEEGLFETLRDKNLAVLGKARFQRIVTGDPHSYHALKNEYGRGDGVMHYSELLVELIGSGKLKIASGPGAAVTYHDPCYLGRYNGVYDAPRRALRALGFKLEEMPRHRDTAYCCGAGGARIWMEDVPGTSERPAESRVREAATLGVSTIAVACPKDYVMFEDAIKTAGLEGRLEVKDVIELAEERSRADA